MTLQRVIGIGYSPEDPTPPTDQLYRVPIDAPIGRELFPVMAVLLAQVLYLDHQAQSENAQK